MAVECADCGVCSDDDEHFARVRRSFSRRVHHVCPRCAIARFNRESGGIHYWALGVLAVAVALVCWRPDSPAAWILLYAGLLSLSYIAVVPFHEAGHALAARLLGMRLFGVTLGSGPLRRRLRVLGVPVEWRAIPSGGFTHAAPQGDRGIRWRLALLALAGPAVNAALASAVWPWLPELTDGPAWRTPGVAVAACWAGANAFMAVASVLPYRQRSGIGPTPTDGLLALTALFAGPDAIDRWRAARFQLEAGRLCEQRRFAEALQVVRDGVTLLPDDENLRSLLGVVLVDVGRTEEARELFLAQLEGESPDLARALTLNNVAWCDFLSGRDERLEEAEACSEEALRLLPWFPAVQSTRGAVLVWSGRAEEALPLLERAFEGVEQAAPRASVACVRALGLRQLGRTDQAKQALELAQTLDPACPLLQRVN